MRLLSMFIIVTLLVQVVVEVSSSSSTSDAEKSISYQNGAEGNVEEFMKKHHTPTINCNYACARRCSKSSRKNVCHRACKSCCITCHCVPPGTYGNKGLCPCYAKLKTHGNKPKCP